MAKIRVLVADDQEIIREGLTFILNKTEDIEVVATAENGQDAVAQARQYRPDVALMDIKMPGIDGIAATHIITTELPETRVIILTTYDTDDLVYEGIRAGAQAYLLKGAKTARLADAIRGVHAGEALLDPALALRVMDEFRRISASNPAALRDALDVAQQNESALEAQRLSPREMEVLALLAQGLNNKDIAATLYLTEGTIRNYISSIMSKLHANDRTQVVIKAAQKRLIKLD